MSSLTLRPSRASVLGLFAVAVAVSVVHYVDNTVNYADFPQSDTLPNPSQVVVASAWFVFTAAGLYGVRALVRGERVPAAVGLAIYSGSGLVGVFHYAVPGALEMPWWRHAHVVADIVCGVLIFAVALRLARGDELT